MNGLQEGLAFFTSAKGKTRQGLWENGKRIKWVKQESLEEIETSNILSNSLDKKDEVNDEDQYSQ